MVKNLKNDQERRDQETTVRVVHKNVTEEYSRVEEHSGGLARGTFTRSPPVDLSSSYHASEGRSTYTILQLPSNPV